MKHTLEEEGTVETNALGGIRLLDWCTVGGGINGVRVFGLDHLSGWHLFVCEVITPVGRGMGWSGKFNII